MTHPTHETRYSDSSFFDSICVYCGSTDSHPTALMHPCTATDEARAARRWDTQAGREAAALIPTPGPPSSIDIDDPFGPEGVVERMERNRSRMFSLNNCIHIWVNPKKVPELRKWLKFTSGKFLVETFSDGIGTHVIVHDDEYGTKIDVTDYDSF